MGVIDGGQGGFWHQANCEQSELTIKSKEGRKYKKYLPRNDVLFNIGLQAFSS